MRQNTLDTLARALPFGLYMTFVALLEIPTFFGAPPLDQSIILSLYPVKISLVALTLFLFRKSYTDLDWGSLRNVKPTLLSLAVGVGVFIVWIHLDFPWAIQGELSVYDPTSMHERTVLYILIIARVVGAAVIVPIMEELFWRSFLSRYLVGRDFMLVRAGTFTLFSFATTSALFGLEHQLYLAGIMAGIAYNALYWKTGSLSQCILSHGVTNGILAGYVILTRSWHFW